jgi:HEAT repeat protein
MSESTDDLRSPDPEVRAAAIERAAASGDPETRAALLSLVHDPDVARRAREAAAAALVRSPAPEGEAAVLELFGSSEHVLREIAAVALAASTTSASLVRLVDGLTDATNTVRNLVERSLLTRIEQVRREQLDRLVALLGHEVVLTRSPAARLLGSSQAPEGLSPLSAMLRGDAEWLARMWAAKGLGDLGDAAAAEVLEAAIRGDDRNRVRAASIEALSKLRAPGSEAVFEAALQDADAGVRKQADEALKALGRTGILEEEDPFAE